MYRYRAKSRNSSAAGCAYRASGRRVHHQPSQRQRLPESPSSSASSASSGRRTPRTFLRRLQKRAGNAPRQRKGPPYDFMAIFTDGGTSDSRIYGDFHRLVRGGGTGGGCGAEGPRPPPRAARATHLGAPGASSGVGSCTPRGVLGSSSSAASACKGATNRRGATHKKAMGFSRRCRARPCAPRRRKRRGCYRRRAALAPATRRRARTRRRRRARAASVAARSNAKAPLSWRAQGPGLPRAAPRAAPRRAARQTRMSPRRPATRPSGRGWRGNARARRGSAARRSSRGSQAMPMWAVQCRLHCRAKRTHRCGLRPVPRAARAGGVAQVA
jgi:hypothetical protein